MSSHSAKLSLPRLTESSQSATSFNNSQRALSIAVRFLLFFVLTSSSLSTSSFTTEKCPVRAAQCSGVFFRLSRRSTFVPQYSNRRHISNIPLEAANYRAVRWSALPLFDERKKRLALLRTWLCWIPEAIVLFPSQCCTHLFKTTRSNRKSCLPPIFREVIQKPCKRTKTQPTVGRVDFSTKEPRRCFSILLVWRTCWHTGFHVLGSLGWTFIYVTPSTLSTIDYLHESMNILHV